MKPGAEKEKTDPSGGNGAGERLEFWASQLRAQNGGPGGGGITSVLKMAAPWAPKSPEGSRKMS